MFRKGERKIVEVYIDIIFLKNFILNVALLTILKKALKDSRGFGFLILGAAVSGIFGIFPYLLPVSLPALAVIFLEYILCPILVIKIVFGKKKWKDFLKTLFLFCGINFFAGGFIGFLYDRLEIFRKSSYQMLTFFGMVFFLFLFLGKGMEIVKKNFLERKIYIPVILKIGEKKIVTTGLMDTGNHLKEPISQKPVILMERELLNQEGILLSEHNFYAIPYHSVGRQAGILRGFLADEIILGNEHEPDVKRVKQVMVGICEEKVSRKGEYSLILNPML